MDERRTTPADRNELARLLYLRVKERAESHGLRFGDDAEERIVGLTFFAADRVLEIRSDLEFAAGVNDAVEAFNTLVDTMVRESTKIQGYRLAYPSVIGERTLTIALASLCPLFPIC